MHKRNAFTLVELLVVIAIIGILATLITQAAVAARQYVKVARIKMEMHQIEMALEHYKSKYGEYPPDWSDQQGVLRHVKKRWPRFRFTTSTPADQYIEFCSLIFYATGWNPRGGGGAYIPEDMAFIGSLPFWLGGLPNDAEGIRYYPTASTPGFYYSANDGTPKTSGPPHGAQNATPIAVNALRSANQGTNDPQWNNKELSHLIGFSTNPENPFDVGPATNRTKSLDPPTMEFEIGRNLAILVRTPTVGSNTAGGRCTAMICIDSGPVAYFRAMTNGEAFAYRVPMNSNGTWDTGPYDFYCNLGTNGTHLTAGTNRFKSLWNNNQYADNNTNGMAYRFDRNPNAGLTRFYSGLACPYLRQAGSITNANNSNNVYFNPKTYQLIHTGLDGKFGGWVPGGSYGNASTGGNGRTANLATGDGVGQFDMDNIVNFGEGTIKATLP